MKQKKIVIAIIMCLLIVALGIGVALIILKNNTKLDDNYYAKLCSGTGEQIECTYLYNLNNNFSYVSTKENTEFWGSSKWKVKIIDEGRLKYPQDIINIAKNNSTAEYVVLNKSIENSEDKKIYNKGDIITLEEFYNLIVIE